MNLNIIKSYAKINLALNVVGKTSKLHKIESLIADRTLFEPEESEVRALKS